ncbi:MAG: AI-2E family transporter [Clostridia bacterium]|nr:AI-2E family transporter [Clostridia bacterium]
MQNLNQENSKINNTTENNTNNEVNTNNTKRTSSKFVFSIFLAIFLGIVIANVAGGYIGSLIQGLCSTLTAFASALVIIFILKHLMNFIENTLLKHFLTKSKYGHRIKRTISILVSFAILILTIFLVMSFIVPQIIEIITELVNNKDSYVYQIKTQLSEFIASIINTNADDTVNNIMKSISAYLEETFNNFLPQLLAISTSTVMTIGQICMGGILAFLYLYNRETINGFFAKLIKLKCKPITVKRTYNIMEHSDKVLLDYIVAKIIEAIVITVVIGIGLSIVGINYAFELALLIGILNVIPYIGFIIALVPLTLLTLIYGSVELTIQAVIVTAIIYIILTTFITPVIVGKKIKINMLLMFSAMIIFGGMFGIIGMAIAPPVACIMAEIFKERMSLNSESADNNCNIPQDNSTENIENNEIENSNIENTAKLETTENTEILTLNSTSEKENKTRKKDIKENLKSNKQTKTKTTKKTIKKSSNKD